MKRYALVLFTLMISATLFAQEQVKNELGLGIGRIWYFSTADYGYYRLKSVVGGRSKLYPVNAPYFSPDGLIAFQQHSTSLPALSYMRVLYRNLSCRLIGQYSSAKDTIHDGMGWPHSIERPIKNYRQRNYYLQFGLTCSMLKNDPVSPFIGLSFAIDRDVISSIPDRTDEIKEEAWSDEMNFKPVLSGGAFVKISRNIGVRYEAALATDGQVLMLSPINQLALTFSF